MMPTMAKRLRPARLPDNNQFLAYLPPACGKLAQFHLGREHQRLRQMLVGAEWRVQGGKEAARFFCVPRAVPRLVAKK